MSKTTDNIKAGVAGVFLCGALWALLAYAVAIRTGQGVELRTAIVETGCAVVFACGLAGALGWSVMTLVDRFHK